MAPRCSSTPIINFPAISKIFNDRLPHGSSWRGGVDFICSQLIFIVQLPGSRPVFLLLPSTPRGGGKNPHCLHIEINLIYRLLCVNIFRAFRMRWTRQRRRHNWRIIFLLMATSRNYFIIAFISPALHGMCCQQRKKSTRKIVIVVSGEAQSLTTTSSHTTSTRWIYVSHIFFYWWKLWDMCEELRDPGEGCEWWEIRCGGW